MKTIKENLERLRSLTGVSEGISEFHDPAEKLRYICDKEIGQSGRLRVAVRKAFEQEFEKEFAFMKKADPRRFRAVEAALASAHNEIMLGFQKATTELNDLATKIKQGDA